jgi:glutathione S-transferase
MSSITVHHLDNSRSQRVLWLLEELGLDYEVKEYKRDPKTIRAPESLKAVHPLGKSPVVELEDGTVLAESGAIIEELLERFGNGRLRPALGTDEHRRYLYWMHYAEGSLMPPLLVKLVIDRVRNAPLPFFIKPIAKAIASKVDEGFTDPEIGKQMAFMESELGKSRWFAGDELTGADIQMSYPVQAALARGGAAERYPRLAAWLEAVQSRDAWKRGIERGGPMDMFGG